MSLLGGGAPKCGRCSKSVYKAEERVAGGHSWHPRCFTCTICNTSLDSTTVADRKSEDGGSVYCKTCYQKHFGPKGYGYGSGAGTLSMDAGANGWATDNAPKSSLKKNMVISGNNPPCARCGGEVYLAEQVIFAGSAWHKECFNCLHCAVLLDSITATQRSKEVYCTKCYAKNFGPKGCGFGAGSGTLRYT